MVMMMVKCVSEVISMVMMIAPNSFVARRALMGRRKKRREGEERKDRSMVINGQIKIIELSSMVE